MKRTDALERTEVEVGFIPILCSAPLILAHASGLFEKHGLHVRLTPAPGWSGIKELIAYEKIDAAHMLAPMPLACNLGIDGKRSELRLAAIQNVNGQALTLAKKHLGIERVEDMKGLTFGVPYRFSMHYYLLCCYLAAHGVDPLRDVTIIEVAPPNMPQFLARGWVDGVLAPEPFNQIPVNRGTGFIHVLSKDIWNGHPCCCFATTRAFAEANPNTYRALLGGLLEAEATLHFAGTEERRAIARTISDPEHLNLDDPLPAEQVLSGRFPDGRGAEHRVRDRIDFVPHPFVDYGSWALCQMQRWGQLEAKVDYREVVESTFDSRSTLDLIETLGFDGGRRSSTHRVGFDGTDPFAYMAEQPFSSFEERAADLPARELPPSIVDRLTQINDRLAEAAGGRLEVEFSRRGDDELGRLEELLDETLRNARFSRLLLGDRNSLLRTASADLRAREEDLRTTLASIGDGVIGTDTRRRVTRLNRAAEALTGWTEADALGRPVGEVFRIVHEETREPAPDPVARVLATGSIQELANHTVLIARDGVERAIADSAAPIRDASDQLVGVVLVFRDQTEERLRRRSNQARLELLQYAASHPLEDVLVRALDAVAALVGSSSAYWHPQQGAPRAMSTRLWSSRAPAAHRRTDEGGEGGGIGQDGILSECLGARASVVRNDIGSPTGPSGAWAVAPQAVRELAVPVVRDGAVVAVLGVGGKQTDYTTRDVELVAYLADVTRHVVDQKLAQEALRQEELKVSVFLENTSDLFTIVEADGRFRYVNKAAGEVFGRRPEEMVGELAFDRIHPDDRAATQEAFAGWVAGGVTSVSWENRQVSFAGDVRHMLWTIRPRYVDGQLESIWSIARDISARKEAEETLRELNESLARSNRELEQFAYVASHDLQEPLRMVASYTQLLARRYEGQLDERADKYIGYAVDGAQRMQGLIDDLLAYSRAGAREAPLQPLSCREIVDEVLHGLTRAIEEAGAEIVIGDLPRVMADRIQLGQVLQNLVGNAVKFIGEGSPRVEITAERAGGAWAISVADNGIGIDPKYHDRIFTIFQRLHERGRYAGSGIGLSIVKKIVERHGGRIWIESGVGQGARFVFTLRPADDLEGASDG